MAEVARFERASTVPIRRSDDGLRQFHAWESRGEEPETPNAYFAQLLDGKKWWEWTVNEYAGLYGTNEWPGWATLEEDFKDDLAGLRQIRQRLRMGNYDHSCA